MLFREIGMEAPSPPQMLAFYGERLGLPAVAEHAEEVAVRAGATVLRFRTAPLGKAPTYHFAIRVAAGHFEEAKAWLAPQTELVADGERDEFEWDFWGARAVYAHDPAGNIIELIAFAQLDRRVDGRFGPESLLGVAELGLPVSDPMEAVARLADSFGIGLWDRDEVTPHGLTPVGEQGATLLVSPIGREWLFGGPAQDHPLDIVLAGVREGSLAFDQHPYRISGEG